jgi:hypothetical protein
MRNVRLWLACALLAIIIAGLVVFITTRHPANTPAATATQPSAGRSAHTHLSVSPTLGIGTHGQYSGHDFSFTLPPNSSNAQAQDTGNNETVTLQIGAVTVLLSSQPLSTTLSLKAYLVENGGHATPSTLGGHPADLITPRATTYQRSLISVRREEVYLITVSAPRQDAGSGKAVLHQLQTSFRFH